jgi:hypothetical protein
MAGLLMVVDALVLNVWLYVMPHVIHGTEEADLSTMRSHSAWAREVQRGERDEQRTGGT